MVETSWNGRASAALRRVAGIILVLAVVAALVGGPAGCVNVKVDENAVDLSRFSVFGGQSRAPLAGESPAAPEADDLAAAPTHAR